MEYAVTLAIVGMLYKTRLNESFLECITGVSITPSKDATALAHDPDAQAVTLELTEPGTDNCESVDVGFLAKDNVQDYFMFLNDISEEENLEMSWELADYKSDESGDLKWIKFTLRAKK